ncbi:hypothetical protein [Bacillus suaedae]|uniref:Uncharacterized protein n=1 Tax=Halalkalibacter suaedae TaxID=2822140 RepID=A0A940WSV8_9BACI|nr:hypothetical protein [Bacillus suaedae]MBP3951158.1 hypothetical protein [Bacillus suaedae]
MNITDLHLFSAYYAKVIEIAFNLQEFDCSKDEAVQQLLELAHDLSPYPIQP